MVNIEHRPLLSEERAMLQRLGQLGWRKKVDTTIQVVGAFLIVPFIGFLIGTILGMVIEMVGGVAHGLTVGVVIGIVGGLVIGGMMLRSELMQRRALRERCQRDIAANEAEVWHCTATDAVIIGNLEDVGFFLDVGDAQVLFLRSPSVFDLADEDHFPNRTFDVIRAPTSGVLLGVMCHGVAFTSSREPRSLDRRWQKELAKKEAFMFSGTLESLESDLETWAKKTDASRGS